MSKIIESFVSDARRHFLADVFSQLFGDFAARAMQRAGLAAHEIMRALEASQRKQAFDEALEATDRGNNFLDKARAVFRRHGRLIIGERFRIAAENRHGGAEVMRDVRDEIALHGLEAFECGHFR